MVKWNCKIYNANYGMSEVCSIMASANDENILKFPSVFPHFYYTELKSKRGKIKPILDCKDGDIGEVIFTSIDKNSQPILRYNSHENIQIVKKDKTDIYFNVVGRTDDMFVYKGKNIYPEMFRNIINQYDELTGLYYIELKKEKDLIKEATIVCENRPPEPFFLLNGEKLF